MRPRPVCTSSRISSAPASRHSSLRAHQVAVGGGVDTLALYGLDDEAGDVAALELARERVEIAKRHRVAPWKERAEVLAELCRCR